jgi:hypothetical protein
MYRICKWYCSTQHNSKNVLLSVVFLSVAALMVVAQSKLRLTGQKLSTLQVTVRI